MHQRNMAVSFSEVDGDIVIVLVQIADKKYCKKRIMIMRKYLEMRNFCKVDFPACNVLYTLKPSMLAMAWKALTKRIGLDDENLFWETTFRYLCAPALPELKSSQGLGEGPEGLRRRAELHKHGAKSLFSNRTIQFVNEKKQFGCLNAVGQGGGCFARYLFSSKDEEEKEPE